MQPTLLIIKCTLVLYLTFSYFNIRINKRKLHCMLNVTLFFDKSNLDQHSSQKKNFHPRAPPLFIVGS